MTERTYTDEDIIKDLICASAWFKGHGRNTNKAIIGICERAVDTIKLLQAENLMYKQYNKQLKHDMSKAVKKFAERLKEFRIKPEFPWDDFVVTENTIDNLVKEFTEGAADDGGKQ